MISKSGRWAWRRFLMISLHVFAMTVILSLIIGKRIKADKQRGKDNQMRLFKKAEKNFYDREHLKPVIRASICTGEQVAGFKDLRTGKIEEVMLIEGQEVCSRNPKT